VSLRSFLEELEDAGELRTIRRPASPKLEVAGLLKAFEEDPVRLLDLSGYDYSMVGNLLQSKRRIAAHFGIDVVDIVRWMARAIDNPSAPLRVNRAPCQEVVLDGVDLDRLPILLHCETDGGRYITSGVCVANHPELGQNLDFHRAMQLDKERFALRVVRGRDFDRLLRDRREIDVAICVGNAPGVLLAAATSVAPGSDEIEIANTLEPLEVVRATTSELWIPADCEVVLEGRVALEDRCPEGPFVDLTETPDRVRDEPVMTVQRITQRRAPIWQALLPGGMEHKLLMGMPREPTIYRQVIEAGVDCLDVSISPGGCSWLHAIVKIRKARGDDARRAIDAAFAGHRSLKHCFVVDHDIDILDPASVEWAFATRFQFSSDAHLVATEPGSSLDPSAEPGSKRTAKVGFDFTAPASGAARNRFEKVSFPRVDLGRFVD